MENLEIRKMELRLERQQKIIQDQEYAIRKIRRCALEAYYRDHLELLYDDGDPGFYKDAMENYTKILGKSYKHILWTVNPREKSDPDLFFKKIEKAILKKWVVKWKFCLEQRGDSAENIGRGMHAHIYTEIAKNKSCYQCKREMYNTFKNLVGNKLHVIPRYSNDGNNFVNYVMGIKNGDEKKAMMEMDQVWRENMGFRKYYESIEFALENNTPLVSDK